MPLARVATKGSRFIANQSFLHMRRRFKKVFDLHFPKDSILYFNAMMGLANKVPGNKNPFMSSVLGPQYCLQADGSYQSNVLNMLTNSGFVGAVSGTPGTAPTGWSSFQVGGSINSLAETDLTLSVSGAGRYFISQNIAVSANTVYRLTININSTAEDMVEHFVHFTSAPSGAVLSFVIDGAAPTTLGLTMVPPGIHTLTAICTVGATSGTPAVRVGIGCTGATTNSLTAKISNPQLTEGPTAKPYVKSPVSGPALGDVVDVIGGRKMLRTCGAVTNLLPSGSQDFASTRWTKRGVSNPTINPDGSYRVTIGVSGVDDIYSLAATVTNVPHVGSVFVKHVSGPTGIRIQCTSGATTTNKDHTLETGVWKLISMNTTPPASANEGLHIISQSTAMVVDLQCPQLTASAYPLPYTPPGTTMPASHATTTNGPWFGLPQYDDAETSDGLFKRDGIELNVNYVPNSMNGGTVSTVSTGVFNITGTGAASGGRFGNSGGHISLFPIGQDRILSVKVSNYNGVTAALRTYNASFVQLAETLITGNGVYSIRCASTADWYYFGVQGSMTIDNISIQKLIPATKTNKVWACLDGEPDGVELVTNGSGDSIVGWEGISATLSVVNGAIRCTNSKVDNGRLAQTVSTVVGQRYVLKAQAVNTTTANIRVGTALYGTQNLSATNLTTNVLTTFIFTATATETFLMFTNLDTTDGGSITIDNISIQRIQPKPMTLAWRGVMGVGSGDLPSDATLDLVSCRDGQSGVLYANKYQGAGRVVRTHDATTSITYASEWARGANIISIVQTNGLKWRVGYVLIGTHTSIQWSYPDPNPITWYNYDGSYNPTNLYKLLLGFNDLTPLWHDTLALWSKQIDDAALLKEMLK